MNGFGSWRYSDSRDGTDVVAVELFTYLWILLKQLERLIQLTACLEQRETTSSISKSG